MPSFKRRRADENEEVEVEAASSSFRQTSHKKTKLARAAEYSGSVVSDDDYPEDNGMTADYHMHDEEPDDDDDDDDNDVVRATQIVKNQARQFKENVAAEYGIIEEVACRNFMCHSRLRVKLGPLINFIIGHNGSGKSAVLTALTMCLGGKASATHRGTSLKSFIKEGEDNASLSVKIKNQGDDAFKPDIYGKSIIVERHFNRAGASGYRLKISDDKVVSTKRADLEEILDYFAFQLDNAINVLNQDMARQFLSNSTPLDKYELFIRGTQLEQLDKHYKVLEGCLDDMEAKLSRRQDDVHALEKRKDEAERKKDMLDRTRTIREKIKQTQCMHAWAQVEEQERVLEKCEADVGSAEERIQELMTSAEGASGEYDGHNQSYEAAQRTVTDLQEQVAQAKAAFDMVKVEFDNNKAQLMDIQAQRRSIHDDWKDAGGRVKKRESDIAMERERLEGAEGGEHTRKLAELEEAKAEAEQAKQRLSEHEAGFNQLHQSNAKAQQELQDAKPAVGQQRDAIGRAETMLSNLQRDQGQQLAAYRPTMGSLIRAIGAEKGWHQKPVGPMGLYVSLRRPEWSSILEKTFGGNMESFLVTNKHDQSKLSAIMKRVNCPTAILIGDPTPLNTTGKEPDANVDTILRILEIKDSLVCNSLIINQAIDQTVLIKDRDQAINFMYGSSRPQNCKATISFAAERGSGLRFEFSRSGLEKSSPIHAWNGRPRMQTDIEAQARQQQDNIRQMKLELNETEQRVRGLEQAFKRTQQEIQRHKNTQSKLREASQRAEDRIEALQHQIEADRPQDGRLQELEDQLAKAKEDERAAQDNFNDSKDAQNKIDEAQRAVKAAMDEKQAALTRQETNARKAEKRVEKLGEQRRRALQEKNLALQLIEGAKEDKSGLETARDKQAEKVSSFVTFAEQISPRIAVEPGVSAEALDKRLDKFYKDIERYEQEAGGSREQLTLAWQKAMQEFQDANGQLESLLLLSQVIKKALVCRRARWTSFRRLIAARAKAQFMYLMSERKFRGRLHMDHHNKALDLSVEPDITKASDAGRQTKTLSGGEKSFSTICLLLSIWEAMGSPIRCLDEFDVFMDSVNRDISMTMMIGAARRSVSRQFILITPQAMGSVELGDDVRVHKMSDPERGQTTLPFGS